MAYTYIARAPHAWGAGNTEAKALIRCARNASSGTPITEYKLVRTEGDAQVSSLDGTVSSTGSIEEVEVTEQLVLEAVEEQVWNAYRLLDGLPGRETLARRLDMVHTEVDDVLGDFE